MKAEALLNPEAPPHPRGSTPEQAPDIVTAILNGAHPPGLTANKLMGDTRLPLEWSEQRRVLGFA